MAGQKRQPQIYAKRNPDLAVDYRRKLELAADYADGRRSEGKGLENLKGNLNRTDISGSKSVRRGRIIGL